MLPRPVYECTAPGWPLRSGFALCTQYLTQGRAAVRVISWRDVKAPRAGAPWRSRFGVIECLAAEGGIMGDRSAALGWEKNKAGKPGAQLADLVPMLNPVQLAAEAVDLNLRLVRWRILPSLLLEKVVDTKHLLLGSSELGCYVARVLVRWGLRNLTLVDSGTVTFSNFVR